MSHKYYDINNNLSKKNKNSATVEDLIETKRFFVKNIDSNFVQIDGDEFNHLVNVMRLKVGDSIILVCNNDYDYHAQIIEISKKYAVAEITQKVLNTCNANIDVTAFVAVNKREPISLMVRMLSELGVNRFVPFTSKWTNPSDAIEKTDRYQKIADQSAKQCRRSKTLQIDNVKKFDSILDDFKKYDIVIFAYEDENNFNFIDLKLNGTKSKKIAFIIGPVAGFDIEEADKIKQNGAISLSLGKRILKADTACITLASLIMNSF